MSKEQEIVMYVRNGFCPDIGRARRALDQWGVPYREINVHEAPKAHQRCLGWNNCLAMPVIVISRPGEDVPIEPPTPLKAATSPRDVDRGYMISEVSQGKLRAFLARHGFAVPEKT